MIHDYALAGYRVASRAVRSDWQDATLPRTDLVSMSGCVVDLLAADRQGWDEWFDNALLAEQARVEANEAGLYVLGVGIAAQDVQPLLDDIADPGWDMVAGSLPERLSRREPLPAGALQGFELVGYDSGFWHSWTCLDGLVRDVREATGIGPGRWGLIQDEQEARTAADWLTVSNLGDPKVSLWVPAALVEPRYA